MSQSSGSIGLMDGSSAGPQPSDSDSGMLVQSDLDAGIETEAPTSDVPDAPPMCRTPEGRMVPRPSELTDERISQLTAQWSQWLSVDAVRWEPSPDGTNCRSWTITRGAAGALSGTLRVTRPYREPRTRRRGTHTIEGYFVLRPGCAEIEVSGCGESFLFTDGSGRGSSISDIGGVHQVQAVSDEEFRVTRRDGAKAWFSTREACMNSPLRANGSIVRCER